MDNKTTFPISIATAIAIQSICGFDPEGIPLKTGVQVKHFKCLYLNIRTLMRNFLGGQDPELRRTLNVNDIIHGIVSDIRIISEIVNRYAPNGIKIVPYLCTFGDLKNIFPNAVFREMKTDIQREYFYLENAMVSHFMSLYKNNINVGFKLFNTKFKDVAEKETLILTHLPIDLLNENKFSRLVLLESHTGKLKTNVEWNTKLKNFKPIHQRIPFNEVTIQFFGDTGDMFAPVASPKVKDRLAEISEEYHWTPLTTISRMISCTRISHEADLANDLQRFSINF
jgi:hypothetical protein